MDLVYVVGPGDDNEELRYSLRSVEQNLPHDNVWIVGHCPRWVRGVRTIRTWQDDVRATKYDNVQRNLEAACEHPEISRHFALFNDDFHVVKPIDSVPIQHRGTIDDVLNEYPEERRASSRYLHGLQVAKNLLEETGHEGPLFCYALHQPMVMNKHLLGNVLKWARERDLAHAPHLRTLYGNLAGLGGEAVTDPLVNSMEPEALETVIASRPFVATYDESFRRGYVGQFLRSLFPQPSRYEAA